MKCRFRVNVFVLSYLSRFKWMSSLNWNLEHQVQAEDRRGGGKKLSLGMLCSQQSFQLSNWTPRGPENTNKHLSNKTIAIS